MQPAGGRATSGHLAPDAAPSDYGDSLPPAATEAICSTCAVHPDLPCCHNHPHEGNGRRRLAQSCANAMTCNSLCDNHDHPDKAQHPGQLIICQPGSLDDCSGSYYRRQVVVEDLCKKVKFMECFNLDDISSEYLKWGAHAYAGQALIPTGLKLQAYGGWGCHWQHDTYKEMVGYDWNGRWHFWDYYWRITNFRVSLEEGYECVNTTNLIRWVPPPSAPIEFGNYKGAWTYIGTGASVSYSATKSWTETDSNTVSDSFTAGLTVGAKGKAGVPLVAEGEVSVEVSTEWSHQASQTLSRMRGGKQDATCQSSVDCSNGNLYQWTLTAKPIGSALEVDDHTLKECKFVCVPSSMPARTEPRCPPRFCSDITTGCQCCNGNFLEDSMPECYMPIFGSPGYECPDPPEACSA